MYSIWLPLQRGAKCFLVSSSEKKKKLWSSLHSWRDQLFRSWVPLCIIHHHHGHHDGISWCINLIMVNSRVDSWVNLIQTSSTKMEWGHLSIEAISLHGTIVPHGSLTCCGKGLWAMSWRATQDGQVIVQSSDIMWPTGGGNGNSHQYSCMEYSMGRGAWWAIVHGTTENQTCPSN